MAELEIAEQQVSGITILTLKGKITIGAGCVLLRHTIERLIGEEKKRIVLDLAGVGYIDSTGIQTLTWAFMYVIRAGGKSCCCNLAQKIQDLLSRTKFLTVMDVYDGLEKATAALDINSLHAICPIYGCGRHVLVPTGKLRPWLKCYRCKTKFRINLAPSFSSATHATVISLHVPTYDNDSIFIVVGPPTIFRFKGRLDLFTSEVFARGWRTLAPPRRGILSLTRHTILSEVGLEFRLSRCSLADGISKMAILKVGEVTTEELALSFERPSI